MIYAQLIMFLGLHVLHTGMLDQEPLSYITYLKPCLTAHPQIPSGFQREGASRDDLRYAYPVKIQG